MFHKVTIIGNLGSDPETRYMESGANVCSFSVATNRKWTNTDGSKGEETIWWRVSAWNKLGEICQQYLTKGRAVFLEGTLVPDRETGGPRLWTDQNGGQRASYELRVETMKMLGGGRDDADHGSYEAPAQQRQSAGSATRDNAPTRGNAPQRQAAPAPAAPNRRSTTSAPAATPSYDDDFGADEIPF